MALPRLIRHRPVGLLLAADRITSILEDGRVNMSLARQLPRELIEEAALRIADNTRALQHLSDWLIRGDQSAVHPMAASLLHAATPGWRPEPGSWASALWGLSQLCVLVGIEPRGS